MSDNFGVPPSEFETVDSFASPAAEYGSSPNKGGNKNKMMIIVVVIVLVLLCCCCVVATGGWFYGDQIIDALGGI